MDAAVREREEELCRRTLQALLDMRIKFPGKTDEEAEVILESVSGKLMYPSIRLFAMKDCCYFPLFNLSEQNSWLIVITGFIRMCVLRSNISSDHRSTTPCSVDQ